MRNLHFRQRTNNKPVGGNRQWSDSGSPVTTIHQTLDHRPQINFSTHQTRISLAMGDKSSSSKSNFTNVSSHNRSCKGGSASLNTKEKLPTIAHTRGTLTSSPSCTINGRVSSDLEQTDEHLSVPISQAASQGVIQTSFISTHMSSCSTMDSHCSMPSSTQSEDVRQHSTSSSSSAVGGGCDDGVTMQKLQEMDRLSFIASYWSEQFGPVLANRISQSERKSTLRQYQSCWSRFQRYVQSKNIVNFSLSTYLEYLTYLKTECKLSHRTLCTHRSALSVPLRLGFNIDVHHEAITRLSRNLFLESPPVKKTPPDWNLETVLDTFRSPRYSNNSASIRDLTLKTLFLVALASGNRASELTHMSRPHSQISKKRAIIYTIPSFLTKTQRANSNLPPSIEFPALEGAYSSSLCPVACLSTYLARTEHCRHEDRIFLLPKSGTPMKSYLSGWLAKAIRAGDPQAGVVRGHDTRKVAFSMAFTRNTPVDEILARGNWRSPHVFIKVYLNPIADHPCVAGRA